jgi:pimeloyl-ACP methyl ester carboxylesterase
VISRRSFLGAGLGLGASAGLLTHAYPAGAASLPLPPGADTLGQGSFALFEATDLNFQTLIALGGAGINSQVGEVLTAVMQANAAPGGATYQSVYDAMTATGNRLLEAADDAARRKRAVTARDRYLRAAQYYNQALFWVLGTTTPGAEESVYLAMDAAFAKSAARQDPAWERVEIPYGKQHLPGWFLRAPGASGRRPTLIMNNGSDGQNVDMLPQGAAAALARGWHVLLFEGPGQGRTLFVDQVPFTPDWHSVVSPIVDLLQRRTDVDPERIALIGVSFGGLLVMRAGAFEHRLAAIVSDPGAVSDYAAFPEVLQQAAQGDATTVNDTWASVIVPFSDPAQQFALRKRLEIFSADALRQARASQVPTDWYSLSRRIQEFDLGDLAAQVRTPTLVVDYELEAFFPGQAATLADQLRAKKELVHFTTVEGAQYHDAPIGSQWHGEVVMDWLDEQVR